MIINQNKSVGRFVVLLHKDMQKMLNKFVMRLWSTQLGLILIHCHCMPNGDTRIAHLMSVYSMTSIEFLNFHASTFTYDENSSHVLSWMMAYFLITVLQVMNNR